MPEGHTIHALADRLSRRFAGDSVAVSSPQGRFAAEAALLDGRELVGASAAGKHLFIEFEGDDFVHVHLGLIGSFVVHPYVGPQVPDAVGAVRLRLANAFYVADLRGPNLCALSTPETIAGVLGRLGPDPLRPDADPELAWAKLSRSGRSIAELLMDQAVVAGVGNVYRCEVLWAHRVDPFRPGREIRPATWRAIWGSLVTWLPLGVRYGQILTLPEQVGEAAEQYDDVAVRAAHADHTGERLGTTYDRRLAVYKRTGEPCLTCGSKVKSAPVAGRTLYWCGRCQRRR